MCLNLHQPCWFLMPKPHSWVIFYWHMCIRYSFKSLFIDIHMGDGDGFVPIIWPSLWLLFDVAGLMGSCVFTLAHSLVDPIFNIDSMRWLSQFELFVSWSLSSPINISIFEPKIIMGISSSKLLKDLLPLIKLLNSQVVNPPSVRMCSEVHCTFGFHRLFYQQMVWHGVL